MNGDNSGRTPVKFGDSLNSQEILVFTSSCNVFKVPNPRFITFIRHWRKLSLKMERNPYMLQGIRIIRVFLIVAFENGKVGKIDMKSFKTEFKRKKLRNAFNAESQLVFIERIDADIDLVAVSSIDKIVLFNTEHINPVGSRTTKGVQVMKQKDGSKMVKVIRTHDTKLIDPEFYRKGLNVVGFYLKKGDDV